MPERKFNAADGAIEITVPKKRRSESEVQNQESERGIISRRKFSDYPKRRRRVEKYIRLFDMGRRADGSEFSDFLIQPELDLPNSANPAVPPNPVLSDYAFRDEYLLETATDSDLPLAERFFEIKKENGDFYRLAFFGDDQADEIFTTDNPNWNQTTGAGGVKVSSGLLNDSRLIIAIDSLQFWRNNLFHPIIVTGSTRNKVTTVFDYGAADQTDFRLKAGDKVFLLPLIPIYHARASYFFGGQNTYLNQDFRFGQREYYESEFSPAVDVSQAEFYPGNTNYQAVYQAMQFHQNLSSARAYHVEYDFDLNQYIWSSIPPSEVTPDPPFSPGATSDGTATMLVFISPFLGVAGVLVAIVERGQQRFYLWKSI